MYYNGKREDWERKRDELKALVPELCKLVDFCVNLGMYDEDIHDHFEEYEWDEVWPGFVYAVHNKFQVNNHDYHAALKANVAIARANKLKVHSNCTALICPHCQDNNNGPFVIVRDDGEPINNAGTLEDRRNFYVGTTTFRFIHSARAAAAQVSKETGAAVTIYDKSAEPVLTYRDAVGPCPICGGTRKVNYDFQKNHPEEWALRFHEAFQTLHGIYTWEELLGLFPGLMSYNDYYETYDLWMEISDRALFNMAYSYGEYHAGDGRKWCKCPDCGGDVCTTCEGSDFPGALLIADLAEISPDAFQAECEAVEAGFYKRYNDCLEAAISRLLEDIDLDFQKIAAGWYQIHPVEGTTLEEVARNYGDYSDLALVENGGAAFAALAEGEIRWHFGRYEIQRAFDWAFGPGSSWDAR